MSTLDNGSKYLPYVINKGHISILGLQPKIDIWQGSREILLLHSSCRNTIASNVQVSRSLPLCKFSENYFFSLQIGAILIITLCEIE